MGLPLLMTAMGPGWASAAPANLPPAAGTVLGVPIVRQAPERCGQAALEMVLRFYGADPRSLREGERAYDPVLRGSLITDLAAAARRGRRAVRALTRNQDQRLKAVAERVLESGSLCPVLPIG